MAKNPKQQAGPGQVRKSYAVLAAVFTFALGFYGGYLFNSLSSSAAGEEGRSKQSISQPQASQAGGQVSAQNPSQAGTRSPDLERLLKAVREDPQSVEAWNRLGHWYFDNRMPREAIQAYDHSLELRPDDPNIITDQGVMYRSLHDHQKALELFRKANSLDPSHEQSLFNTGIALLDVKQEREAIKVWKQLQSRNPNFRTPQGINIGEAIKILESK